MSYETKNAKAEIDKKRIIPSERIIRFKERLSDVIGNESVLSFAKKSGMSEGVMRSYIRGDTFPSLDRLEAIANAANVDISWLVTGNTSTGEVKLDVMPERIIEKPKFNIVAAAGGGSFIDTETPAEYYTFTHSFLKRHRLLHADLCVIDARGDSMEPTISDGDELVLKLIHEPSYKPLDGVYVFNHNNSLRVKRLEFDMVQDGYRIISDNKLYPEEFISRNDLGDINVIGKVVLVMGAPTALIS